MAALAPSRSSTEKRFFPRTRSYETTPPAARASVFVSGRLQLLFLFTKAVLEGHPIDVFNHGKIQGNFNSWEHLSICGFDFLLKFYDSILQVLKSSIREKT
jgi:hypothetical protein